MRPIRLRLDIFASCLATMTAAPRCQLPTPPIGTARNGGIRGAWAPHRAATRSPATHGINVIFVPPRRRSAPHNPRSDRRPVSNS